MRKQLITPLCALLALVGPLVACSDDDPNPTSAAEPVPEPEPVEWEVVEPGGDCQCSDGSRFNLWVRKADPDKVLVFFRGGGACWSAETCARDGKDGSERLYTPAIEEHPNQWDGIFDFANESNPFADYSIVYVPYCTGDVFLGDATTTYADGLTIQHKGYVNGTAAVDYAEATFPDATQVVVAGLSAGSVSAPLYGGLVADRFPDARITVLADSSGQYPAAFPSAGQLAASWGLAGTIPDWPENAGLTPEQWTPPTFYVQSGKHAPDITFARHDYAYDSTQAFSLDLLGVPEGDLLALIDGNEAGIEAAGVPVAGYTAPGDDHGVLQYDTFYSEEVEGVRLVDWVTRLIAGEPVDDVHCVQCEAG